ncbi:hypothetical protein IL306_011641 [Fusarium sp. DS 682]|nr:hypothetical protein IL306_011641 [Fusarium sp. DS 682]
MADHLYARYALDVNPDIVNGQRSDINITVRGSDWYWAVCAVMTVSTFAFLGLGMRKPRTDRIFHYITAGITMIASIAYFSMASNLGWTPIAVEFRRSNHHVAGYYREIFYGVCEGGNLIAPDSEAVFYGILDLIAKPAFGALLLWGHRNIDPARLGLRIRDINEPIYPEGPNTKPGHGQSARNDIASASGASTNPNA